MNELTCAIIKQINRSEFGSVKGIEMDKYLELKEKFENCASHSRYFSDELDAQFF